MPQNYAKIVKTTPFLVFAPIKNKTEDRYGFCIRFSSQSKGKMIVWFWMVNFC